jgi:hypothetical protein
MKEIILKGSFYEMGQQYGIQFKKLMKLMLFEVKLMAITGEKRGRDFFRPNEKRMKVFEGNPCQNVSKTYKF